jgi:hypothetical protein
MKKYINFLLLILFSNFIILSCAGTSEDEDEYAGLTEEEKRQQQELDEIESLLGISTDKSETKSRAKKPTQKKEEKLGLLSSEDLAAAANQPVDTKKIKKLEKENSKLLESTLPQFKYLKVFWQPA